MRCGIIAFTFLSVLLGFSLAAPVEDESYLPPGIPTVPNNGSASSGTLARRVQDPRLKVVCQVAGCCTPFNGQVCTLWFFANSFQFIQTFTPGGQLYVGAIAGTTPLQGNFVGGVFTTTPPFLNGQIYLSPFQQSVFVDHTTPPFAFWLDPSGNNALPFQPTLAVDINRFLGVQGIPATTPNPDFDNWSVCAFGAFPPTVASYILVLQECKLIFM